MSPVSGIQYRLSHLGPHGEVRATVTELAAGLRELSVGGRSLVQSFGEDVVAPKGCGLILVPWPNRVRDARWTLDGEPQQLDVTEAATGNASHGLLRNCGYREGGRSDAAVTLLASVFPQHGYPFHLDTSVAYALVDDGLRVTHTIVNRSARPAPVAVGAHPYLALGGVSTADLTVTIAADSWFETDEQRIPVVTRPVDGTDHDLRSGVRVGDLAIDVGLGDVRPIDGGVRHRLTAPDGDGVELWADDDFRFVQVYTPSDFPTPEGPVQAIAIEPMTAPADALNSGTGLRWLEPDEQWSLSWGIRLTAS
ncbi:aldose 1-epimerase family protein [Plantibacter sp. Leaf314]|uniref:aldose 1-epimerase family protein n=1 Tax=Plantibacter sp. Leaf314 TaxID=1736333 RepID=UPI0006F61A2B|nr:aldose 1-epimerase family protein [Plantibacter sp. Leaf314]KQQ51234.1 aldose epimerase [Plantibacter sp. Leaf314]